MKLLHLLRAACQLSLYAGMHFVFHVIQQHSSKQTHVPAAECSGTHAASVHVGALAAVNRDTSMGIAAAGLACIIAAGTAHRHGPTCSRRVAACSSACTPDMSGGLRERSPPSSLPEPTAAASIRAASCAVMWARAALLYSCAAACTPIPVLLAHADNHV